MSFHPGTQFPGSDLSLFSADKAPTLEPLLVLNGDLNSNGGEASGLINNLAVLTNVSPDLAPPGKHLISVSVLDDQGLSQENLSIEVKKELEAWFGAEVASYEHIKNYQIRQALPDQTPPWLETSQKPVSIVESGQTIYLCGDHRETASIHGALVSGRRAAEQVSKDLKVALSI
jgi:Flavin containing amine oxidoreductase.